MLPNLSSSGNTSKRKTISETKPEPRKRARTTNENSSDDEIRMIGWRPANITVGRNVTGEQYSRKHPIVIDLTAEDDDVVQPPRKQAKISEPRAAIPEIKQPVIYILDSDEEEPQVVENNSGYDSDYDSDYDNIHHGYTIGRSFDAPEVASDVDDVDSVEAAIEQLSLDRIQLHSHTSSRRLEKVPVINSGSSHPWQMAFTYDLPPTFFPLTKPWQSSPIYSSFSGGRSRTGFLRHRSSRVQTPLTRLARRETFKMADACHTISQNSGKVLVTSATPGGVDEEDEFGNREFTIDPYNTPDTLAVWTEESGRKFVRGHSVNSNDPGGVGGLFRTKYYDVKCARFDPHDSNVFVSTGLDGVLTIWNADSTDDKRPDRRNSAVSSVSPVDGDTSPNFQPIKRWGRETYGYYSCHDIVFRPEKHPKSTTWFAAPCENGLFIHSYTSEQDNSSPSRFSYCRLRPEVVGRNEWAAGATVWGIGLTSSEIFVSSETSDNTGNDFVHGVFDIDSGRFLYSFDDHRSGEELALDPAGNTLALFTSGEYDLNLRLYDVRRQDKQHISSIGIPVSSSSDDLIPEVRTAQWSPDGILLAVSKNDDMAHLYDVRCLKRGPLLDFAHERPANGAAYGITVMSWTTEIGLRTPNLGLVTGGSDHKFCLWDIKTACEEARVIAELEWGVSVGHFGDLSRGEKPLVAGDVHGNVYIYDFGRG